MQGQYLQHGSSTPTARLFFYNTADGTPATVLFNAASLALVYARDNGANVALTLVTATLGTWVANGFISRGGGVHDLYLPTTAVLTGAKSLTITSTGLPTGVSMNPCIIPLGADDIAAAAATDATIAPAVWANSTRTLTSAGAGGGATASEVWAFATRTLTASPGPDAATIASAVWSNGTRTLTSFGTLVSDTATAVWAAGTRTLTSFGTLVADTATAVWSAVARTLTSSLAPTAAENATATRTAILGDFAAIPSAASNAAAVEAALLDNIAAIPAALVTAMRTENLQQAIGVTSQPVGGSTVSIIERRNGVTVGTRSFFYDSTGKLAGYTVAA